MNENKNMFYVRVHRWVGGIFKLFFPLQVEGLEHVTGESVIFCPNPSSAIDPLMLAFALPRTYSLRIMAKKQLMDVPVLGWLLRKLGVFGVDRGNADMKAARMAMKSLKEGSKLLMFPEGTRVKEGESVDAKAGAALFATRCNVPLLPVYIYNPKKLFKRSTVVVGQPYMPEYEGRKATSEELQKIVQDLQARIYALEEAAK